MPLAAFDARFVQPQRPVVLVGYAAGWPAREQWTTTVLRARFGDRPVAVARTVQGNLVHDPQWGVPYRTLPLAGYLDLLEGGGHPGWYLTAAVSRWLPELMADVSIPPCCVDADWRHSRIWLAAAGTGSPLHRDLADNLFVQVTGRKRFLLAHCNDTPWLYSHGIASGLPNFSRVDVENLDLMTFPLAGRVGIAEVVLEAGDALYLPRRWWHQVRALETGAAINFWWASGAAAWPVRVAETYKRYRGLEL